VIVIVLQEVGTHANVTDHFTAIHSHLTSEFNKDYLPAYGANLGGVALFLFFRKSSVFQLSLKNAVLIPHTADSVTEGKASICPRISAILDGHERFVTVIGSHLECREEEYERRNTAWKHILKTISESDSMIFVGDLNYRIELPRERVLELINQEDVATLLQHDQLEKAKRANPEFQDFQEIHFLPTYKFDLNSDLYDTSPKQRTPSYTDRILISSHKTPIILEYQALAHRPGRARF
jgi:hypothetical protein